MTKKTKAEIYRIFKSALSLLWINNFVSDKEYERILKRIKDREWLDD